MTLASSLILTGSLIDIGGETGKLGADLVWVLRG
jgi:hypothetical protein